MSNDNNDMMVSEIMLELGLGRAKVESLFEDIEPAYKSRRFVFYSRKDFESVARTQLEQARERAAKARQKAEEADAVVSRLAGLFGPQTAAEPVSQETEEATV